MPKIAAGLEMLMEPIWDLEYMEKRYAAAERAIKRKGGEVPIYAAPYGKMHIANDIAHYELDEMTDMGEYGWWDAWLCTTDGAEWMRTKLAEIDHALRELGRRRKGAEVAFGSRSIFIALEPPH